MNSTNLTQSNTMDSSKIKQLLFAGKAAVEQKEFPILIRSIEDGIKQIYENNFFEKEHGSLQEWLEIFESVIPSQIAPNITKEIHSGVYFKFGKYLSDIISKENTDHELISRLIHNYLDVFRFPEFLTRIYGQKDWEILIHDLIIKSNFTVNRLFEQRVIDYGNKTLFKVLHGSVETDYSWLKIKERTSEYAKSLIKLLEEAGKPDGKVAFLMQNEICMAVLDLACLTGGIVNLMIPANTVPQHLAIILNQTKAPLIIVSDEKQLHKIKIIKSELKYLQKVILRHGSSGEDWIISFNEFINAGSDSPDSVINDRLKNSTVDSLASIMYTSGTTGEPKGIMFSQMNIVYKRFCRAMAIPKIGDKDRFLAYLPLYHTFGRWLEMMGSIFWGTTYVFMENPAVDTMIANMKQTHPTIFISIPKKWVQLYEYITARVDIEIEDEEVIKHTVEEATGGKLKWGLSAAGYLSPDVFQFFQKYGVELMSGFGMTEATGGITMTPPQRYIPDSLGGPLPGIEIKLADDGEILIRGSYVMMGYFGDKEEETFLPGGWLPTGDIMQMDENGFIEIVDRKKEIYKNIKGETVAPQKIENYFRDFDTVKQVFLAGDHRPFNTVLIYPNYEGEESIIKNMQEDELHDYFSSVIVTVNKFLAPFERIVDFRIINRPFSDEKGELTPKGTFKRRVIEKNFAEKIESMYVKDHTSIILDNTEVRLPNWFLREKGCLSGDIIALPNGISIPKLQLNLKIEKDPDKNLFKIGDYFYTVNNSFIDMQLIFTNPLCWLGNEELFDFTGDTIFQWYRQNKSDGIIQFHSKAIVRPINTEFRIKMKDVFAGGEQTLYGLHIAVLLLNSGELNDGYLGLQYIRTLLEDRTLPHYTIALKLLHRPNITPSLNIRRELFKTGLKKVKGNEFGQFLELYLLYNSDLIDDSIIRTISDISRGDENLTEIENILRLQIDSLASADELPDSPIPSIFSMLSNYGIQHPTSYKRIRQVLMHYRLFKKRDELISLAREARLAMLKGFRNWLGSNQDVAVDMETGEEYRWSDVIILEEGIDKADSERIIKAITETAVLREAIFLFSEGTLIGLNNILPGGLWISHLGTQHEKSVYRVTVQTRFQGAFDLAINLNKNLPVEKVKEEINWLVLAGSKIFGQKLVEDFGGYWEDYDLWTEEFVPGETVAKFLYRESRKKSEATQKRLYYLWPYFVWSAAAAYFNFWKLTGYTMALADPQPSNIIIPHHDYQTGTRLVSISERIETDSREIFFSNFFKFFIKSTEETYPFLKKKSIWNYVFSGIIEAEGEIGGLKILESFKEKLKSSDLFGDKENIINRIDLFVKTLKEDIFIPKKLFFAIKRFHRWFALNKDAALTAQAEMIYELYETYQMYRLEEDYPETRAQFFLATVFSDSSEDIKKAIRDIVIKQHERNITKEETLAHLSDIQTGFNLNEKEFFFLTRLSYPHLKPTDSASLMKIKSEGTSTANLVVQLEDDDGNPFLIRNPISPKEISRLHQLFIETNLLVHFRPEHQFLVALSERGFIIGGLFYLLTDKQTAHMEKIVVSNRYRRKGMSEGLMNELFNRLRDEHIKFVTTGFFRPEYFYRFGFKIERKYSGLVKDLFPKKDEQ